MSAAKVIHYRKRCLKVKQALIIAGFILEVWNKIRNKHKYNTTSTLHRDIFNALWVKCVSYIVKDVYCLRNRFTTFTSFRTHTVQFSLPVHSWRWMSRWVWDRDGWWRRPASTTWLWCTPRRTLQTRRREDSSSSSTCSSHHETMSSLKYSTIP